MLVITRIVSGGQKGVDRGALDAAIDARLEHGGWCPRGRLAEDGAIPPRYRLAETPSPRYEERTEWNVRDSGGTLVLTTGPLAGGTKLTVECARQYRRPCMIVDLGKAPDAQAVVEWIGENGIEVLNVAGPRESESPGITFDTRRFVAEIIDCDTSRTPEGS